MLPSTDKIFTSSTITHTLRRLPVDCLPLWGRMTAQHMVEHLAAALQYSNGTVRVKIFTPAEKIGRYKQGFIYSEVPMPRNFISPLIGDALPALRHPHLSSSIEELLYELNNFEQYFQTHPQASLPHPVFGELVYPEWLVFHEKHFRHHFEQFDLRTFTEMAVEP